MARSGAFGRGERRQGRRLRQRNVLAWGQPGHTLRALAPGLPVFDVLFRDDDGVEVEARGFVTP